MTDQELWTKANDLRWELEDLDWKNVGNSLRDVAFAANDVGKESVYDEAQELSSQIHFVTNPIDEIEDNHSDVWENAEFTADERVELQNVVTEMESLKEEIVGFLDKHCADE